MHGIGELRDQRLKYVRDLLSWHHGYGGARTAQLSVTGLHLGEGEIPLRAGPVTYLIVAAL